MNSPNLFPHNASAWRQEVIRRVQDVGDAGGVVGRNGIWEAGGNREIRGEQGKGGQEVSYIDCQLSHSPMIKIFERYRKTIRIHINKGRRITL